MEPVSVLMKAEKLYCLQESEHTKDQEAPVFSHLCNVSAMISQKEVTSSPGATVFQYKLEIIFLKSVKCIRYCMSIEPNYNDFLENEEANFCSKPAVW